MLHILHHHIKTSDTQERKR